MKKTNHLKVGYIGGLVILVIYNLFFTLNDAEMPLEDLIAKYRRKSDHTSIGPISRTLARSTLLVAVEENPAPDDETVKFRVTTDEEDKLWAYMFTDQEEFSLEFPNGGQFRKMWFPDAFRIINRDKRYGGIQINSSPKYKYQIEWVMFDNILAEWEH